MKHPLHKHIYKAGNKYYIQKSINNKLIFFKSCSTIDEAIKYRDKLKENNWKPLPLTDEELMEKQMKKYYMYVRIHGNTYNYVVCNRHEEYLGITKSIEEALYFRDLYIDTPKEEVPHIREVDLRTNNPYIENGLDYPLPERLILPERNSTYGKGSIVKKGETSYHLHHGKKGKGATSYVCSCATYEQAYYVREKLNECNWNLDELPRILDEYPVWYTELLYFYQYVNRHRVSTRQKAEKAYRGWEITIPNEFLENKKSLEKIGPYTNIEDALFERDFLKEHNWNYTLLVETINDKDNPYYDMDLPPYPSRKIRNISDRNYHEKELQQVIEYYKTGITNQSEMCKLLGIADPTIRNWLKKWNTNWKEFTGIIDNGENPLTVLEKKDYVIQPDLSKAMPNNFSDNIHKLKNGTFQIMRRRVYYGAYPSHELAKKIVKDLKRVNWDKSKLKEIQSKHGYISPVMSKRWVYPQGRKWAVRRKDKNKKFINYGSWYDKRIAELVRDMLLMHGFNITNRDWIVEIAEWTIEMIDLLPNTMFSKTTLEDIYYINHSESTHKREPYLYAHEKPGHYQIRKRINGKFTNFGTYPYDKAIQVRDFLKDNDWNKELLELMQEMGEI